MNAFLESLVMSQTGHGIENEDGDTVASFPRKSDARIIYSVCKQHDALVAALENIKLHYLPLSPNMSDDEIRANFANLRQLCHIALTQTVRTEVQS